MMFKFLLIAAGLSVYSPAQAMADAPPTSPPLPSVAWQDYTLEGPDGQQAIGQLGTIMVAENRKRIGSRKIPLKFVRLASTSDRPGNPVVYLAGGPGGSAVRNGQGDRFGFFQKLRAVGDVILLDQRGTGLSNVIPECPVRIVDWSRPLDRANFTETYAAELRRCITFWRARGVEIEGYNTEESAADLEAMRAALGADRLNLVGLSYGTHLGMAALKQNVPVERVVFAGLEGLDQTVKLPAHLDAFLVRVATAVSQSPEARAAYPDLLRMIRRVHAKLEREPATVTVPAGGGRPAKTIKLGSFSIQLLTAFALISDPERIERLPAFYAHLDRGDFSRPAAFLLEAMEGEFGTFSGMPQLMDLASGISTERRREVDRQAPNAFFGDATNFPMPHLLDLEPGLTLPPSFRSPLSTAVPTLLIASTMDGRTPIESQEELLPQFRNATRLTVTNGGHNIWEQSEVIQDEVVNFLQSGVVTRNEVAMPPLRFAISKTD